MLVHLLEVHGILKAGFEQIVRHRVEQIGDRARRAELGPAVLGERLEDRVQQSREGLPEGHADVERLQDIDHEVRSRMVFC